MKLKKLKKLFDRREKVLAKSRQSRVYPGGSLLTPNTIIVTNKRVIIVNPSMLGLHKKIESYPFSRIFSVQLFNGIFTSKIILKIPGVTENQKPEEAEISALPKKEAREIFNIIQEKIRRPL